MSEQIVEFSAGVWIESAEDKSDAELRQEIEREYGMENVKIKGIVK